MRPTALLLPVHTPTDCLWCRGLQQNRLPRQKKLRTFLKNITGISLVVAGIVYALERLP